ncbi:hypothetical protein WS61_08990 [Burkholderia sp. ABCPW 11]|nr:hypothetical protein WS61_08990 [Burkholderia sp. ABCPW 11]
MCVEGASGGGVIMNESQRDTDSGDADTRADAIREGAVRWLLWLRAGDTTERERDAFGRWRAQSDEHVRTVRELIWMWAVLETVGRPEPGEPGGSTRTH